MNQCGKSSNNDRKPFSMTHRNFRYSNAPRMKQMLLLSLPPTIMPPGNSFGSWAHEMIEVCMHVYNPYGSSRTFLGSGTGL